MHRFGATFARRQVGVDSGVVVGIDTQASARRYRQTVDSAGPDAMMALFDAETIYRRPGYAPIIGRAALLAFYGGQRVIAHGEHVIANLVAEKRACVSGRAGPKISSPAGIHRFIEMSFRRV